jgi:hypothetical protein
VLAAAAAAASGCAAKHAGTIRGLDEEYGFRGVAFHTPLAKFRDLEFVEVRNGLFCFQRQRDNLRFGRATLSWIKYCFYKGRFASVIMWGAGTEAARGAYVTMQQAYGEGEVLAGTADGATRPLGRIWKGDRVTAIYLFAYRRTYPQMDTSQAVVTISSNDITAELEADWKAWAEANWQHATGDAGAERSVPETP